MKTYSILFLGIILFEQSGSYRISRQDEYSDVDEDTTPIPTNGHLIGTLAGVVSSILRSGPNGTSPIKFNLTRVVNKISNIQLFPLFKLPLPIFSTNLKEGIGRNESLDINKKNRSNLNFRSADYEDYDEEPYTKKAPNIYKLDACHDCVKKSKPTTFVETKEKKPRTSTVSPISSEPRTLTSTLTEVTPPPTQAYPSKNELESFTTPIPLIDLRQVDINGLGFWISVLLNPAIQLAKDATRNVSIADSIGTVFNGTAAGVKGITTVLPVLTEAIRELVDAIDV